MGRRKKQELPFEHWQIIELLHIAQDFYSKPENEAAFQEWKAARDARKAKRPPDTFSLEQFFPLRHPQFFLHTSFKSYFFSYIVSAALYSISKNCPAVGR